MYKLIMACIIIMQWEAVSFIPEGYDLISGCFFLNSMFIKAKQNSRTTATLYVGDVMTIAQ